MLDDRLQLSRQWPFKLRLRHDNCFGDKLASPTRVRCLTYPNLRNGHPMARVARSSAINSLPNRAPHNLCSVIAFAALLVAGTAQATTINPSQSVGPIPAAPGTGLLATYTTLASPPATLTAAGIAATLATSYTTSYLASTICFPTCVSTEKDGNSLASYVAANGTNLVGSATLGPSYSSYTGFLAISTPGVYGYTLNSDDGSALIIGGTSIIDMPNQQTWSGASGTATFTAVGLYPIEVDQFDIGGYTGITLMQNWQALPASSLYATQPWNTIISEPAPLVVLGVGLVAIGMLRQRFRKIPQP